MDLQNNNGQATGLSLLGGRGLHDYSVDIDNLEVRMDTAETNITSNDTELADHGVRIDTAEANIEGLEEDVLGVGGLAGRVSSLESDVQDLQDYAGEGNHVDSHLVHTTGDQTIDGFKTFTSDVITPNVECDDILLNGTFTGSLQSALDGKAEDSEVVHKTGNQTIDGLKTFKQSVHVGDIGQTWASGYRSDLATNHGNVYAQTTATTGNMVDGGYMYAEYDYRFGGTGPETGSTSVKDTLDGLETAVGTKVSKSGDTMTGHLTVPVIQGVGTSNIHKILLWSSTNTYSIGMSSGFSYGGLGTEFATTFTMNNTADRGWLFRQDGYTDSQGCMSLTNAGKLTVASNTRIGYGIDDTTAPSGAMLDVNGDVNVIGNVALTDVLTLNSDGATGEEFMSWKYNGYRTFTFNSNSGGVAIDSSVNGKSMRWTDGYGNNVFGIFNNGQGSNNSVISYAPLEITGGGLTVSGNAEITYKGETLDARFHPSGDYATNTALATETSSRIAGDALKLNLAGGTITGDLNVDGNVDMNCPTNCFINTTNGAIKIEAGGSQGVGDAYADVIISADDDVIIGAQDSIFIDAIDTVNIGSNASIELNANTNITGNASVSGDLTVAGVVATHGVVATSAITSGGSMHAPIVKTNTIIQLTAPLEFLSGSSGSGTSFLPGYTFRPYGVVDDTSVQITASNSGNAFLVTAEKHASGTTYYGFATGYDGGSNEYKIRTMYNTNDPNADDESSFSVSGMKDVMRIDRDTGETNFEGDLSVGGTLTATGNATINNAYVGVWSANSAFSCFSHNTKNTTGNYALIQSSDGTTYLNSASGKALSFRQGNSDKMIINTTGSVSITNNLIVGGSLYSSATVPIITQVHSFIQHDLNNFDGAGFLLHSPTYDANTNNPVYGIKSIVPMRPYAITVSTDGDGSNVRTLTFQIRKHKSGGNDNAHLVVGDTDLVGDAVVAGCAQNTAKRALFNNVVVDGYIPTGFTWGLYYTGNAGVSGLAGEMVIKVYFYQV